MQWVSDTNIPVLDVDIVYQNIRLLKTYLNFML